MVSKSFRCTLHSHTNARAGFISPKGTKLFVFIYSAVFPFLLCFCSHWFSHANRFISSWIFFAFVSIALSILLFNLPSERNPKVFRYNEQHKNEKPTNSELIGAESRISNDFRVRIFMEHTINKQTQFNAHEKTDKHIQNIQL